MRPPRLLEIRGSIGSWTVEVEGKRLASLHNTFWTPPNDYFAPSDRAHIPGGRKYQEFVQALETQSKSDCLVVIQRDADPNTLQNNGYIGVFKFEKLEISSGGIRLRITERYADRR